MPRIVKIEDASYLKDIDNSSNNQRFNYIYKNNIWSSNKHRSIIKRLYRVCKHTYHDFLNEFILSYDSVSGPGSTTSYTKLYRNELKEYILQNHKNPIFFDAPCGDLNWVREFFDDVDYIGGDIANLLIDDLKIKYPNINLIHFDIITDKFPDADIWHCRHCLFHLSLADIIKALENFCQSNIDTAIITNHFLADSITYDIPSGGWRYLDLTNYPFYLPQPKLWLLDSDPAIDGYSMASGVWDKAQIKQGIENYYQYMTK